MEKSILKFDTRRKECVKKRVDPSRPVHCVAEKEHRELISERNL